MTIARRCMLTLVFLGVMVSGGWIYGLTISAEPISQRKHIPSEVERALDELEAAGLVIFPEEQSESRAFRRLIGAAHAANASVAEPFSPMVWVLGALGAAGLVVAWWPVKSRAPITQPPTTLH